MDKFADLQIAVIHGTGLGKWSSLRYGVFLKCGGHFVETQPSLSEWVEEDARLKLECYLVEKDHYIRKEDAERYVRFYCGKGAYLGVTLQGELYFYRTIDGERTSRAQKDNVADEQWLGVITGIARDPDRLSLNGFWPWMERGRDETLRAFEIIGADHPRIVLDPGVPEEIVWNPVYPGDPQGWECVYHHHHYGGFKGRLDRKLYA